MAVESLAKRGIILTPIPLRSRQVRPIPSRILKFLRLEIHPNLQHKSENLAKEKNLRYAGVKLSIKTSSRRRIGTLCCTPRSSVSLIWMMGRSKSYAPLCMMIM